MSYRIDTQITIDEVKLYSCEISVEKYAKPAKKINDTSTIIKDGLKIICIPLKLNRMKIHHAIHGDLLSIFDPRSVNECR